MKTVNIEVNRLMDLLDSINRAPGAIDNTGYYVGDMVPPTVGNPITPAAAEPMTFPQAILAGTITAAMMMRQIFERLPASELKNQLLSVSTSIGNEAADDYCGTVPHRGPRPKLGLAVMLQRAAVLCNEGPVRNGLHETALRLVESALGAKVGR